MFITSHCGVVLELDMIPATPGKECPVCHEPLDDTALDGRFPEPTDPNQVGFLGYQERRETAKARMNAVLSRDPFAKD